MNDFGNVPLSELTKQVQACGRVEFRVVLIRQETGWSLYRLIVDAVPVRRTLPWTECHYGWVLFVAGHATGKRISRWLGMLKGRVGAYAFETPPISDYVNFHRHPSHAPHSRAHLKWPHTQFTVNATNPLAQPNHLGFLVSPQAQTFPDLNRACAKLLYDEDGHWSNSGNEIAEIRIAQSRSWIDAVHLGSASVSVRVAGRKLRSTYLEFQGPGYCEVKPLGRSRSYTCLPNGATPRPWILLKDGETWLDYVDLAATWSPYGQRPRPGVTVEQPDLATQIRSQIASGESDTVEFKEAIPQRNEVILRTVAAFANGSGGVILFGVRDEDGAVVGFAGDIAGQVDRLSNIVRNGIVPAPEFQMRQVPCEDKALLALWVSAGAQKPYGIAAEPPRFYVRRNATTFPARQDEVRALAIDSAKVVSGAPGGVDLPYL